MLIVAEESNASKYSALSKESAAVQRRWCRGSGRARERHFEESGIRF